MESNLEPRDARVFRLGGSSETRGGVSSRTEADVRTSSRLSMISRCLLICSSCDFRNFCMSVSAELLLDKSDSNDASFAFKSQIIMSCREVVKRYSIRSRTCCRMQWWRIRSF